MEKPTVMGYVREQPSRLKYVFENRDEFVKPFREVFETRNIKKVIFLGSGTSYNAGVTACYYFKQIVGIDAQVFYPTMYTNYEKADWSNSLKKEEILFVGISQTGTSISTINAIKKAYEEGYFTLVYTGNLESEITKYACVKTHELVGPELTPPETKGYTVTLMSLYLFAINAANAKGILSNDDFNSAEKELQYLVDNFQTVVNESDAWYTRNKASLVNSDRIYCLGYGVDFGSCYEAQLKVGEMLRVPSIIYEMEEYTHGPTMAITDKMSILMIGSDDCEYERMKVFNKAFKKYNPRVHVITCMDYEGDDRDCVFSLKVNKNIAPLMYAVPFQFVAAQGAADIGIDTSIDPFEEKLAHL